MYKFIKTKDEENQFDITDVVIQTKCRDLTMEELFDMFKSFLQACNFPIKLNEELELVNQHSHDGTEEIEIDLSKEEFNMVASMAHDNDITFNEMVNRILVDQLAVIGESEEEFDSFVEKLKEQDVGDDEDAINEFDNVVGQLKETSRYEKTQDDIINKKYYKTLTIVDNAIVKTPYSPEGICAEENMKTKLVDTPDLVDKEVYEKQFGIPPDSVETVDTILDQPDSVEKDVVDEPKSKTWENVNKAKEVVAKLQQKEEEKPRP